MISTVTISTPLTSRVVVSMENEFLPPRFMGIFLFQIRLLPNGTKVKVRADGYGPDPRIFLGFGA